MDVELLLPRIGEVGREVFCGSVLDFSLFGVENLGESGMRDKFEFSIELFEGDF